MLKDRPIALKILFVLGLMTLLALGISAWSLKELHSLNRSTQGLVNGDARSLYLAATANGRMTRAHQLAIEMILAQTPEQIAAVETRLDREVAVLKQTLTSLLPFMTADEAATYAEATGQLEGYFGIIQTVRVAARRDDDATAQTIFRNQAVPLYDRVSGVLDKLVDKQTADLAQSARNAEERFWLVLWATVAIMGVGIAATLLLSIAIVRRHITGPLTAIIETMAALAAGRLDIALAGTERRDEIGAIARSVGVFHRNALQVRELEQEQAATQQRAEADRQALLHRLADGFERSILQVVESVVGATGEMSRTAGALAETMHRTGEQTGVAAAAAGEALSSVQLVASASHELDSSIEQIARQTRDSQRIAQDAAEQAARTNELIQRLSAASQKIGGVVELIGQIAGQTNLLALNATIEAARAGDAGKGFAVVASEVKNLANQTAQATGEITSQVAEAQDVAGETAAAIDAIGGVIRHINEITGGIAGAVERQAAATQEITRSASQAAAGTSTVTSNLGVIQTNSSSAATGIDSVVQAAGALSAEAGRLRGEVERFLGEIRNAA